MNTDGRQELDTEAQKERRPLVGKASSAVTKTQVVLLGLMAAALIALAMFLRYHHSAPHSAPVATESSNKAAVDANPVAVIQTSMGEIKAEIFLKEMPLTASNFIDLCRTGFYDGTHFHRVIRNFMDQLGDPKSKSMDDQDSWGTGGPLPHTTFPLLDASGKTVKTIERSDSGNIEDEFAAKISNDVGTLAMANTGRSNTGGSQFFINVVHNKYLDWFDDSSPSKHPVFGKVNDLHLAKAISMVSTVQDRPVVPIEVQSCKLLGL
jgi:cyclophilin family peptidyl-prolyl cis-trans isomerase